jgi:hypothetical protein
MRLSDPPKFQYSVRLMSGESCFAELSGRGPDISASEVIADTYWLAAVAGGRPTARLRHPLMGVMISASVLYMYKFRRNDMLITDADCAWWKNAILLPPLAASTTGKSFSSLSLAARSLQSGRRSIIDSGINR